MKHNLKISAEELRKKLGIDDQSGKEIVRKINSLKPIPELQIDVSHIRNLSYPIGGGVQRQSSSSPSGGVQLVTSGTGINVDNTDPANPIINNTGITSISGGVLGTAGYSSDFGTGNWFDGIIGDFVKNGDGDYTIAFLLSQPDENYAISIALGVAIPDPNFTLTIEIYDKNTDGFSFYTKWYRDQNPHEAKYMNITINRTLIYS